MNRLSQLDFFRGIALLGVIMVHVSQNWASAFPLLREHDYFWIGRYGVPLFFAISGFTIMMMYESYEKKWKSPVPVFYIKRILRLYPLFFLAAFIYLPLDMRKDFLHFNPDGIQVMDFVRVLTFTGGIDPHLLNAVVPGGWSIVNEIYFYLCFPLFLLVLRKASPWLLGGLVALANIGLVMNADALFAGREAYLIDDFMFRNFFNSIPAFYAGVLSYSYLKNSSLDFFKFLLPIAVAGIWLQTQEPRSELLLGTALSLLFFVAIVLSFRFPVLKFGMLEKFGTVTYTGYIIHFGIIEVADEALQVTGLERFASFEIMFPAIVVITAIASYLIAGFTERYWQNLANRICTRFFGRAPDTESAVREARSFLGQAVTGTPVQPAKSAS